MNAAPRRTLACLLLVATASWASGLARLAHERLAHAAEAEQVATPHDHDQDQDGSPHNRDDDHGDCAVCHLLASSLAPPVLAEPAPTPDRPTGTRAAIADSQSRPDPAIAGHPPARGPPALP